MTIFLCSGCKNGKTALALKLALKLPAPRFYIAAMLAADSEDRARIERHVAERAGLGFTTIEQPQDIARCLERAPKGTLVIDSVTALLLNEMFPRSFEEEADSQAAKRTEAGLLMLAEKAENALFISDYIHSDAALYDSFTENYRRDLAALNRALARACDTAAELCAEQIILHKGRLPA